MLLEFVNGLNVDESMPDQSVCHRAAIFRALVSQARNNAELWGEASRLGIEGGGMCLRLQQVVHVQFIPHPYVRLQHRRQARY